MFYTEITQIYLWGKIQKSGLADIDW